MRLVICGDTHFSIKEPFYSASKEFCRWFNLQEFNNENNYFLHLGDLYTDSNPNPKVHHLAIDWFKGFKFLRNYVLVGNHDYNRSQDTYSCSPISHIDNTQIIYRDTLIILNKLQILLLPFMYDKVGILKDKTLKEYYETLHETTYDADRPSYIFHHIQDNTIDFGDHSGINLDGFNCEKIGGHIHIKQKGYLGTPIITRADEKNKKSYILTIDLDTHEKEYIEVPQFLDYEEINFEQDSINVSGFADETGGYKFYRLYDIINSPSISEAYEKFKNLCIHKVILRPKLEENNYSMSVKENENNNNKTKTTKDWFKSFSTINKTNKKVQEKVMKLI